uniref:Uncharacterized protein n=1 Tax=Desulfobacca acetoxidans TaxID=60893 RepID=A0A7C3Z046_9BACT
MKKQLQVLLVLVAVMLLATPVVWAKKEKGGGGPQIPPVISAEQAKTTVTAALPKLAAGKPFSKTGKQGDIKLEVPLTLGDKIVARVRLNPATGEILTKGQRVFIQKLTVTPEHAGQTVQGMVRELQTGAPWLGKQGEWKVPLLYKGAVVSEISVHGQNGTILPDWKASKDATMFGR